MGREANENDVPVDSVLQELEREMTPMSIKDK